MSTITCPGCGARFTLAADIPPEKKLHCRKCETSFTAGEAVTSEPREDAEDALEAAGGNESARSRLGRSESAPGPAFHLPVLLVSLGIVAASTAVAVLAQGGGDAPDRPGTPPPAAVAEIDPAPPPVTGPPPPSDDEMAFLTMAAAAASGDDHARAARFAAEKGLSGDWAKIQWEWAVIRDPGHADARAALGHSLYDGRVRWAKDKKWLTAADLEKVKAEEASLEEEERKLAAERAADPWLKQVDQILSTVRNKAGSAQLAGIDFRVSEEYRPYLILIEEARDFHFKQIGTVLSQFYTNFQDTWGKKLGLKPVERPLVILAFKSNDGYDTFAASVGSGGEGGRKLSETTRGIYLPSLGFSIPGQGFVKIAPTMIYGVGSESYPYRPVIDSGVFTHEATHQIMDYYTSLTGVERSHWFAEGFAEYSGALIYHRKSDRYRFNDFLTHRDKEFRETLKDKKALTWTLKELLTVPNKRAMEQRAREKAEADGDLSKRDQLQSLFYAEAWYWIWYCKKGPRAADLWPKFEKYVEAEFSDRSGISTFQEIFQIEIDEALEKEWLEFVKKPLIDPEKDEAGGGEPSKPK